MAAATPAPPTGSFLMVGNLGLLSGVVDRPYTTYTTGIPTTAGITVPASIRFYTASNTTVLPDQTVVFVIAKVQSQPNRPVILEPLLFQQYPGDPSLDLYDYAIPEIDPVVFVTGHVATPVAQLGEEADNTSVFILSTNEWLNGGMQASTLQFVFDKTIRRWQNPPHPAVNSCVSVTGQAFRLSSTGCLSFKVLSLSLNLAARPTTAAPPPHEDSNMSPAKRRRFAPTRATTTAAADASAASASVATGGNAQASGSGSHTATSPCPTRTPPPVHSAFRSPSPYPSPPAPPPHTRTFSECSPISPTHLFDTTQAPVASGSSPTGPASSERTSQREVRPMSESPLSSPGNLAPPTGGAEVEGGDEVDESYINLGSQAHRYPTRRGQLGKDKEL